MSVNNTQLNASTTVGDVIATDEVAGIKHQLVKVEFGPDGAATRVDTGTPLPVTIAGAATSAKQDTGNASLAQIHADLGGTLAVLGVVAVSNLPATQPVSGSVSVSNLPATQPVSGTVTANAGTNLNTSALATEAGHLATIDTSTAKIPSQGQALAAGSIPVVLTAIQQTALTPPAAIAGFALEAGHLATIDTSTAKIPPQGQALAAASLPVVLPATQITTLTPPAAITGFALEAGHLATIDTSTAKIPSQGQTAMAASMPVTIASNQSAIPVTGTFYQANQPVSDTAIVSDADTNYTQGTQSNLTITSGGKLRIEVDDIQRRIEEMMLVEMQKQTLSQMFINEPYSGSRYGIEIR